jgi:hypothetical protein
MLANVVETFNSISLSIFKIIPEVLKTSQNTAVFLGNTLNWAVTPKT